MLTILNMFFDSYYFNFILKNTLEIFIGLKLCWHFCIKYKKVYINNQNIIKILFANLIKF